MAKVFSDLLNQSAGALGRVCARITSFFSFPTHTCAHFAQKLQKTTKCFQYGYKTKTKLKHRTHYAIFQNRRIYVQAA